MIARIPTLGFPSRTDAVAALQAKGMKASDIAAAIGIPVKSVYALLDSAGRRARPGQPRNRRPSEVGLRAVAVPMDVLEALAPFASPRGITVNELARRLIETALDDGLVDGILDDLSGPGGTERGTHESNRIRNR